MLMGRREMKPHIDMKTVVPLRPKVKSPTSFENGEASVQLALDDAMACYDSWPKPTTVIADGPYGLGKFPGEPNTADGLGEWYAPHIAAWSRHSTPATTLWFWCSEVGWAEVHSVLKLHGWTYKAAHVWDKGVGHVAGNCNGDTIRGFPVVTELCVQYVREAEFASEEGKTLSMKEWLRSEWLRSGLPLNKTNEACGVANAATRKYFTQCHLWYFPPPDKMMALAGYAKTHGKATNRPYFSLDGKTPLTEAQWTTMRAKWNHTHGLTNVWSEPAVRGSERIKAKGLKALHINQKPLSLTNRIIQAASDPGDVIWEPFGGLCSAAVVSLQTGRHCYASEVIQDYYLAAVERLEEESLKHDNNTASIAS